MSRQRRHATVITIVASLFIVPATAAAARSAGPPANDNRAAATAVQGLPATVSVRSHCSARTSMPIAARCTTAALPTWPC